MGKWYFRRFRTPAARDRFIERWQGFQFVEIVVNNGYGLRFKKLRVIDIE